MNSFLMVENIAFFADITVSQLQGTAFMPQSVGDSDTEVHSWFYTLSRPDTTLVTLVWFWLSYKKKSPIKTPCEIYTSNNNEDLNLMIFQSQSPLNLLSNVVSFLSISMALRKQQFDSQSSRLWGIPGRFQWWCSFWAPHTFFLFVSSFLHSDAGSLRILPRVRRSEEFQVGHKQDSLVHYWKSHSCGEQCFSQNVGKEM